MEFEMSGFVQFWFSGVLIEGDDPHAAIHEVETMSVGELLEYSDDTVDVQVTKQEPR